VELTDIAPFRTQPICYYLAHELEQMKKWLEQQGATFHPGKGSHLKVFLNGKQPALPMHGTMEHLFVGGNITP